MGIENSWSEDEDPLANFPIPLPMIPSNSSVEVGSFIDRSVDNGPFTEDLECLFSPIDQATDSQEDTILDGMGEAGVCGLRNLGNTCFMSAGVQCLVATSPIVHSLLHLVPQPRHQAIILDLVDLTRKIWSGQYGSLQPSQFKSSLALNFPQFNDYRQHDCQEFLALLLDTLHEQMNTAVSKDFACQVEPQEFKLKSSKEASTSCPSVSSTSSTANKWNSYEQGQTSLKRNYNDANAMLCKSTSDMDIVHSDDETNNSPRCNITKVSLRNSKLSSVNDSTDCDILMNNKSSDMGSRNDEISILNNAVGHLSGLEDILKDAKTSNVNVLDTEQEANNEIRFDSEKYPRLDNIRRNENFNYNSFHENNTHSGKRCKKTATHYSSLSDLKDGLDLKRIKLYCSDEEESGSDGCGGRRKGEKNKRMEQERKHKDFDQNILEKNYRMEHERKEQTQSDPEERNLQDRVGWELGEGSGLGTSSEINNTSFLSGSGDSEGDKHWQQHLAVNRSIIVSTFQGQFKSTVVCSVCKFVSVTYEPFMYLSVPLPNALKKQICVTFVGRRGQEVIELLVEVNRNESVATIKEQVLATLGEVVTGPLVMAEVLNHHITKHLDDSHLVRDLNNTNRSLYAFEVISFSEELPAETTNNEKEKESCEMDTCCTICLEDKEVNMRRHIDCSCILCDVCVTASCKHHGRDSLECPVCRKEVDPKFQLIPVQPIPQVVIRMINMPVVFRVDETGDGNNNQKSVELFGHPVLLRVPNRWSAEALRSAVASLVSNQSQPYRILLVDGQGTLCSKCMYNSHCHGCPVANEGSISLYSRDTLAIAFSSPSPMFIQATSHPSMSALRPHQPLSLYDCIHAFSQSEQLDEQNPWYCPRCRKNQCATKTLSIWRYPDYLIVYLKRFIFHDRISTKLEEKVMFPLCDLNLGSHVTAYDLYACVCHVGGVSAGHYTTYTQHPISNEWHFYNDSYVSKQSPQEDDYSNAYILFYRKKGVKVPNLELEPENTFHH